MAGPLLADPHPAALGRRALPAHLPTHREGLRGRQDRDRRGRACRRLPDPRRRQLGEPRGASGRSREPNAGPGRGEAGPPDGKVQEKVSLTDPDATMATTGVAMTTVTADAGYAYAKVYGALERRGIDALIPTKAEPIRSPVPLRRFRY